MSQIIIQSNPLVLHSDSDDSWKRCDTEGEGQALLELFATMDENGVEPDAMCYNAAMYGCAHQVTGNAHSTTLSIE